MSDSAPNSNFFDIEASAAVRQDADAAGLVFVPHLDVLIEIADTFGVALPEVPRVLLLQPDEAPYGKSTLAPQTPDIPELDVPVRRDVHDLVIAVHSDTTVQMTQNELTMGAARTLAERGQAQQRNRGIRWGGAITLAGATAGLTTAELLPTEIANGPLYVSGAVITVGALCVAGAYARYRGPVDIPARATAFGPPITVEPVTRRH